MILFFNVFITPNTLAHRYNRGGLHNDDKVNVFKYAIESIAPIYNWSNVIIQFELDEQYKHRYEEVTNFLYSIFDNEKVSIRPGIRNTRHSHWKKTVEELKEMNDKKIFFSCNHDQIFIDCNSSYFGHCVERFEKYENENSIVILSAYVETIKHLSQNDNLIDGPLFMTKENSSDSFVIMTMALLELLWGVPDLGERYLSRTDGISQIRKDIKYNYILFGRNMFLHYDGHHNLIYPDNFLYMKYDPPVNIPNGYFDKEIKINYNYSPYSKGHTNILLDREDNFTVAGENGSDYFFLDREIPMAWKGKICEFLAGDRDLQLDIEIRLKKIKSMIDWYSKPNTELNKNLFMENKNFIDQLYN